MFKVQIKKKNFMFKYMTTKRQINEAYWKKNKLKQVKLFQALKKIQKHAST